mmetsp:Transcript_36847/g.35566  ORF Transcript_36847/g.35566 Transcript_36847/m.35566 type:complete len:300 (-) Transcript_36847:508-1407(-)
MVLIGLPVHLLEHFVPQLHIPILFGTSLLLLLLLLLQLRLLQPFRLLLQFPAFLDVVRPALELLVLASLPQDPQHLRRALRRLHRHLLLMHYGPLHPFLQLQIHLPYLVAHLPVLHVHGGGELLVELFGVLLMLLGDGASSGAEGLLLGVLDAFQVELVALVLQVHLPPIEGVPHLRPLVLELLEPHHGVDRVLLDDLRRLLVTVVPFRHDPVQLLDALLGLHLRILPHPHELLKTLRLPLLTPRPVLQGTIRHLLPDVSHLPTVVLLQGTDDPVPPTVSGLVKGHEVAVIRPSVLLLQ